LVEYIGNNYGKASFYGIKTGNQYRAGKSHKVVPVDKSDLHGSANRPGLLDLKENNKPLFRLYVLPAAPAPVKLTSVKKAAPVKKAVPQKVEVAEPVLHVETPRTESVPASKKKHTRMTIPPKPRE
jgi:hypothetical protein